MAAADFVPIDDASFHSEAFNALPFARRAFWSTPTTYEVWWEDPRDIFRVEAVFAGGAPDGGTLDYWRRAWPKVRVPKGAVVGAGESGWLANDDWTNGEWQPADAEIHREGEAWTVTFRPLNEKEFPAEKDFPARFRRTLKLRLNLPAAGAKIERLAIYTDSTWREAEYDIEWKATPEAQDWSGRVETFNGKILSVTGLDDRTQVNSPNWDARPGATPYGGVRVRARCAFNEDRNSFDRTILTLRTRGVEHVLPGVSFLAEDVEAHGALYIRDLGILVRKAGAADTINFAAYEQAWQAEHSHSLYERIAALPEQTWERSWANMARKTSRMYFTLGCEGSRQKFGLDPDGSLFLWENFLRRAPGKDTPKLDLPGRQLRIRPVSTSGVEPADRSLLEGCLPVIHTAWTQGSLAIDQEAYATWLWGMQPGKRMPGDDPMAAMLRVRFTNLGSETAAVRYPLRSIVDEKTVEQLEARDGWVSVKGGSLRFLVDTRGAGELRAGDEEVVYALDLGAGQSHEIVLKVPHLQKLEAAEREQLSRLDYQSERARVVDFWRQRIDQGAQIVTPNQTINDFYRTHLMHMLVVNDREPGSDRNVARCGGFHYGSYPNEGVMGIMDLDRRGLHKEAERCLELYLRYQGTAPLPGNFQRQDDVFYGSGGYQVAGYNNNHGWVLYGLAEHFNYTQDREWLEHAAPHIVRACQWIADERQATMQTDPVTGKRSISYGFLPTGSLEDVTDYWTWLGTNTYMCLGFRAAAGALAQINHPEAARLVAEAAAFERDLKAGYYEAAARSPVVQLRDGRWVPHFPSRQERRGRDFGWLREVLEGACHLVYCGLVPAKSIEARWILEDFEDNLFLSRGYGYQAEDFERQWFDWGGFSMQSNLLLFPPIYLWRDEPKHYLRGYFNAFTSAFFPDTVTMCEHALPDLAHWRGDHFKTSDEANSNGWLRGMFLAEEGRDLWVGPALPRAWLEHGQSARIERAATYFGETSVTFRSLAATGSILIHLDPPRRSPPDHIWLRVRHPGQKPMQAVWVNGLPHDDFDPAREVITLTGSTSPLEIRVLYEDVKGEQNYSIEREDSGKKTT